MPAAPRLSTMCRKDPTRRLIVATVVGIFVLGTASGSGVLAQAKSTTAPVATPVGAFEKLSLGNQKVAWALYQAQSTGAAAASTSGAMPGARLLSLDEIAAKRRTGQEWGRIFREMKAQGLVREKSLGQVVSRHLEPSEPGPGAVASGKSSVLEVGSNGSVAGAAHGIGKGGK